MHDEPSRTQRDGGTCSLRSLSGKFGQARDASWRMLRMRQVKQDG